MTFLKVLLLQHQKDLGIQTFRNESPDQDLPLHWEVRESHIWILVRFSIADHFLNIFLDLWFFSSANKNLHFIFKTLSAAGFWIYWVLKGFWSPNSAMWKCMKVLLLGLVKLDSLTFSTHCDCPATVHLTQTIENCYVQFKISLIQHKFPVQDLVPRHFFLFNLILHCVSIKGYRQTKKNGLWKKVVDPTSLVSLYQSWARHWKMTSQPQRELRPPLRNAFRKPVSKTIFRNFFNASRTRGNLKILPTDGATACRLIPLDRRQLGLVREEGQIVNHGNMKNQEYY